MRRNKKSEEEIQKFVHDDQVSIASKKQALRDLINAQFASNRTKLAQAITRVAKELHIDFIADGDYLYCDPKVLKEKGVDVTEPLLRALKSQ